jgi:hypothetical protein
VNDLSLDLETMGTVPGSAVVGIGACFFDTNTGEIGDTYYQAINLTTCVNAGLRIEPGAVMFWLQQPDEARNAICFSTAKIDVALQEFAEWIHARCPRGDVRPWLRGPSFDAALLREAYAAVGIELPWLFWQERCHRTLTARNPSVAEPERLGTHHNALDDARHQAAWLCKIAEHHRAKRVS